MPFVGSGLQPLQPGIRRKTTILQLLLCKLLGHKPNVCVKIKLGDITHPTSLEMEFHYPDYAELSTKQQDGGDI